ncbi:MAG: hypothetical protein A3C79_01620 [Candidatus Taylorbacteria bacterium RIFCSPHIGHO2_02_FULL_45_28]|nr:MAG: hypothetical protein A3C79_01620 [Candidatus Taylorbacteria bacterium RIFCSPHIGHO2_02_FULL_45_28]
MWGVPFSEIEKVIKAQLRKTELFNLASQMAGDLTNGREENRRRRWDHRIGDHPFEHGKRKDRPRNRHHSAEEAD